MSQHHKRIKHENYVHGVRQYWERRLPVPCASCGLPVTADQSWHIGHLIPAAQDGQTTIRNTWPEHAACNMREGGKRGAKITNARRRANTQAARGLRDW